MALTYDVQLAAVLKIARMLTENGLENFDRICLHIDAPVSREHSGDHYDRNALAYLLIGLKDRAKRERIPWSDVESDADVMLDVIAAAPPVDPVQ